MLITSAEQPKGGGTPEGKRPFVRVNRDGMLAVPGTDAPLMAGESLIVVSDLHS